MIKITRVEDTCKIPDSDIIPFIQDFLSYLLTEYRENCPDGSIESIGAIFYLTSDSDIRHYAAFGLSSPITESRFEWLEDVENGYTNGCIVLNNDVAINIIGHSEYFQILRKERNNV